MKYAQGTHAKGVCDRCGLTYLLLDLRPLTINKRESGVLVCDDCWEPDNPRTYAPRVEADAITLRRPRPDNKRAPGLVNITWGWRPVYALVANAAVGAVVVETP